MRRPFGRRLLLGAVERDILTRMRSFFTRMAGGKQDD